MDMVEGTTQGQDTSLSNGNAQSQPAPIKEERTFKQADVDNIVKKVKYEEGEKYKRLLKEQPEYASQKYGENQNDQQIKRDSQNLHENDIRRLASEEIKRAREEFVNESRNKAEQEAAARIVQSFVNKSSQGKEKYQDFDAVTGDIEFVNFPNVVQILADHVDNAHDIMYELGKDRFKIGQLEQLARISPRDAIIQAQRLANSIKENEAASKIRVPNEPLSQMRPSNTGSDGQVLSVSSLRSKYRV